MERKNRKCVVCLSPPLIDPGSTKKIAGCKQFQRTKLDYRDYILVIIANIFIIFINI